ncbi:uncharacterized protein LOC123539645 [Mercenaria mercenaria]|uniref:uncharacterized protein LOC123539645 n=1 Tax=Mercenaria mercenaria TaxID=6596 RepID=UPI00234E3BAA|nr:uncharacterized protein LOC123539645 [Mercenaria mercenaria]
MPDSQKYVFSGNAVLKKTLSMHVYFSVMQDRRDAEPEPGAMQDRSDAGPAGVMQNRSPERCRIGVMQQKDVTETLNMVSPRLQFTTPMASSVVSSIKYTTDRVRKGQTTCTGSDRMVQI